MLHFLAGSGWTPHRRIGIVMGVGGAIPFSDVSAFREMIRQKREIAKAGAGANREAAGAEIKAAEEDQIRLMEEAF